jgi:hypothetical protein
VRIELLLYQWRYCYRHLSAPVLSFKFVKTQFHPLRCIARHLLEDSVTTSKPHDPHDQGDGTGIGLWEYKRCWILPIEVLHDDSRRVKKCLKSSRENFELLFLSSSKGWKIIRWAQSWKWGGGFFFSFQNISNRSSLQNYCVFGLRPSSAILKAVEYNVSETGSVSVFRRDDTPGLLGPLLRANLQYSD